MRLNPILTSSLVLALCPVSCQWAGLRQMPPVIAAAREGDTARLQQLLDEGADPDTRAGVNDWTVLMHAIVSVS